MPQHTGPAGGPRPFLSCTPPITFELEGRLDDIDEDALEQAIGHPVKAETGVVAEVDLVVEPGDTSIESDQLNEIENVVQNELSTTHTVVGWRVGEI